ncbi:MAG: TolC family protein [Bryobacteraceae bacterium]
MKTRRPRKHLLVLRLAMAAGGLVCHEGFSQEAAPSTPKAQQVPLSQSTGSVDAQQSTTGSAGSTSSVNTLNSTIQVSGGYQGSVPDPKAPLGSLTLTISDAIHRGLQFNLGGVTADVSVRQARAQRLAALSQMLPNIYGTLTETSSKVDLQTLGLSASAFGGRLPVPTTVGPFHYYTALGNVSEDLSLTALHNVRQSEALLQAARMSTASARELIVLAVGGTYLRVIANKANVVSQEAQVKQAEASYKLAAAQYDAGTKTIIDSNKSLVELRTQQQRLSALRGDLLKETMQLARLIGLPAGQQLILSEDLPAQVPDTISLEQGIKIALDERPDLKAARLQLKAADEARRASKAEYLPSLSINGDYGLEGINPNKGVSAYQVSASLKIHIFDSGRVRGDVDQADAVFSQLQAQYDDLRGAVDLDVRQAYVDLQVASEQMKVAQENRQLAAETLTQSVDRFASGVTNSVEVVQSQETVAAAEQDYISTLFSLNLSRISLAKATGQAERFVPNMLKGK